MPAHAQVSGEGGQLDAPSVDNHVASQAAQGGFKPGQRSHWLLSQGPWVNSAVATAFTQETKVYEMVYV